MSYTHSNALGKYGVTPLIVATDPANGSHVTLASALAVASTGETVFLRDTVTENVTLPAGINIAAWSGGTLNTPTIIGTITCTDAGTRTISRIRLQTNSAALLAVTGSVASRVNLNQCYLNCTNSSGITFSTSDVSASINIYNCKGDIGTTGIALFAHSSAGTLLLAQSDFTNSGLSTTANTSSAGTLAIRKCTITNPITTSSTNAFIAETTVFSTEAQNVTALTLGGSSSQEINLSGIASGSASAVSISSATGAIYKTEIKSSNTNAVTGAGTLTFSDVTFNGTSSLMNTTTQAYNYTNLGKYKASGQPAFSAYLASNDVNVTGAATTYKVGTNVAFTEVFDVGSNFNTNGTFTAPATGIYIFTACIRMSEITAAMSYGDLRIITTAKSFITNLVNCAAAKTLVTSADTFSFYTSVMASMTSGDTAIVQITISNGAGDTADIIGTANMTTFFQGYQIA